MVERGIMIMISLLVYAGVFFFVRCLSKHLTKKKMKSLSEQLARLKDRLERCVLDTHMYMRRPTTSSRLQIRFSSVKLRACRLAREIRYDANLDYRDVCARLEVTLRDCESLRAEARRASAFAKEARKDTELLMEEVGFMMKEVEVTHNKLALQLKIAEEYERLKLLVRVSPNEKSSEWTYIYSLLKQLQHTCKSMLP